MRARVGPHEEITRGVGTIRPSGPRQAPRRCKLVWHGIQMRGPNLPSSDAVVCRNARQLHSCWCAEAPELWKDSVPNGMRTPIRRPAGWNSAVSG